MRNGGIGASATWGGYGQPQPQQPSGIGASATWGGYGQPQPQQPSGLLELGLTVAAPCSGSTNPTLSHIRIGETLNGIKRGIIFLEDLL